MIQPSLFIAMSIADLLFCYRLHRSELDHVPLYSVFGDTVISRVADHKPRTLSELKCIRGIKKNQCDLYGADILRIVTEGTSDPHPIPNNDPSEALVLTPLIGLKNNQNKRKFQRRFMPTDDNEVYILELQQGKVYVGRSGHLRKRIKVFFIKFTNRNHI